MSEIKLSEQLGAMAIIDELYQKQQLLLEHLDRDVLRDRLKENIRNYYQTKGQSIDDSLIEKGINLWFDKRLRFNAPKRNWFMHFLALCYIKRNILYSIIFIILSALALINFAEITFAKKIKNNIDSTYNHILSTKSTLDDLNKKFLEIDKYPINFSQVPIKKLKNSIIDLLNQNIIPSIIKSGTDISSIAQKDEDILKYLKETDESINTKLSEITSLITQLHELLEKDKKLTKLTQNQVFTDVSKKYPILQNAVDSILDNLNQGQTDIDINRIETLYSSIERAEFLEKKIESDTKQLLELNVPKSDMDPIIALQTSLLADLKDLNFENVENYQTMMAYYIKLAQTNLTLTIVDHPDHKSGVERTHENTNGKSWYLIVQALTPTGKPTSIWVKSIETGESKLVEMFGQQVTLKAFNDVKEDKINDGHIDNNKLCAKPKGRLIFNCPNSVKSGRISEW
ncbi:DUF6384 family protein [Gilliamella apicola]|uniref:DUF6384 family protein n=3 Tax=Gilliamella apicola TaxID=1196095 RepID=UPI00080E4645|nr:DUF6384 family protein [Gilliamella apicola]OCG13197.1 hypothetical protein A9G14_03175 [Gilliamella apicola]ORF46636.1 hypothetical protein B5800_01505 [Gilliamella apicola]ORF50319.1 hypothetical protein B5799_00680 [Gilliamella apicola]ORF50758.1 hypothetical protein B5803_08930 [Gilliamella apicola]ORF55954.1 hypothetical protein B5798_02340 [Gilliamella apicola]